MGVNASSNSLNVDPFGCQSWDDDFDSMTIHDHYFLPRQVVAINITPSSTTSPNCPPCTIQSSVQKSYVQSISNLQRSVKKDSESIAESLPPSTIATIKTSVRNSSRASQSSSTGKVTTVPAVPPSNTIDLKAKMETLTREAVEQALTALAKARGESSYVLPPDTKVRLLASGSFGEVYCCLNSSKTGKTLVIKRLLKSQQKTGGGGRGNLPPKYFYDVKTKKYYYSPQQQEVKRNGGGLSESSFNDVQREVKILEKLKPVCNEYILCYDDFVEDDKYYYLLTEFIADFVPLSELVGTLTADVDVTRIAIIIKNLLNGLALIHSLSISHRDIKPDNILVNKNGTQIKYIDFGLACMGDECNISTRELSGTAEFIAPELYYAWDNSLTTPGTFTLDMLQRGDTYALGLVVFSLLTGANAMETGIMLMLKGLQQSDPAKFEAKEKEFNEAKSKIETDAFKNPVLRFFVDNFDLNNPGIASALVDLDKVLNALASSGTSIPLKSMLNRDPKLRTLNMQVAKSIQSVAMSEVPLKTIVQSIKTDIAKASASLKAQSAASRKSSRSSTAPPTAASVSAQVASSTNKAAVEIEQEAKVLEKEAEVVAEKEKTITADTPDSVKADILAEKSAVTQKAADSVSKMSQKLKSQSATLVAAATTQPEATPSDVAEKQLTLETAKEVAKASQKLEVRASQMRQASIVAASKAASMSKSSGAPPSTTGALATIKEEGENATPPTVVAAEIKAESQKAVAALSTQSKSLSRSISTSSKKETTNIAQSVLASSSKTAQQIGTQSQMIGTVLNKVPTVPATKQELVVSASLKKKAADLTANLSSKVKAEAAKSEIVANTMPTNSTSEIKDKQIVQETVKSLNASATKMDAQTKTLLKSAEADASKIPGGELALAKATSPAATVATVVSASRNIKPIPSAAPMGAAPPTSTGAAIVAEAKKMSMSLKKESLKSRKSLSSGAVPQNSPNAQAIQAVSNNMEKTAVVLERKSLAVQQKLQTVKNNPSVPAAVKAATVKAAAIETKQMANAAEQQSQNLQKTAQIVGQNATTSGEVQQAQGMMQAAKEGSRSAAKLNEKAIELNRKATIIAQGGPVNAVPTAPVLTANTVKLAQQLSASAKRTVQIQKSSSQLSRQSSRSTTATSKSSQVTDQVSKDSDKASQVVQVQANNLNQVVNTAQKDPTSQAVASLKGVKMADAIATATSANAQAIQSSQVVAPQTNAADIKTVVTQMGNVTDLNQDAKTATKTGEQLLVTAATQSAKAGPQSTLAVPAPTAAVASVRVTTVQAIQSASNATQKQAQTAKQMSIRSTNQETSALAQATANEATKTVVKSKENSNIISNALASVPPNLQTTEQKVIAVQKMAEASTAMKEEVKEQSKQIAATQLTASTAPENNTVEVTAKQVLLATITTQKKSVEELKQGIDTIDKSIVAVSTGLTPPQAATAVQTGINAAKTAGGFAGRMGGGNKMVGRQSRRLTNPPVTLRQVRQSVKTLRNGGNSGYNINNVENSFRNVVSLPTVAPCRF